MEIFNSDFFFFTQKIFNINQKNYESDKGIFRQFYFYFKRTVEWKLKSSGNGPFGILVI